MNFCIMNDIYGFVVFLGRVVSTYVVCLLFVRWRGSVLVMPVGQAWASPAAPHPVDRSPCYRAARRQGDGDFVSCAFGCGGARCPRCGAGARAQDCFGLPRTSSVTLHGNTPGGDQWRFETAVQHGLGRKCYRATDVCMPFSVMFLSVCDYLHTCV